MTWVVSWVAMAFLLSHRQTWTALPARASALRWRSAQRRCAAHRGRRCSLVSALDGTAVWNRNFIAAELTYVGGFYHPMRCLRTVRHKLIVNFSNGRAIYDSSSSLRPRSDTIVPPNPIFSHRVPVEFYDLVTDPLEHRNLARDPAAASACREMMARLWELMVDTDDPLLRGPIAAPMHDQAINLLRNATKKSV